MYDNVKNKWCGKSVFPLQTQYNFFYITNVNEKLIKLALA